MTELLTSKEVASILKVTTRSISNYVKNGQLKAVRIGKVLRFEVSEVEAFIERCKEIKAKKE